MSKLRTYFSAHRGLTIAVAMTTVIAIGAGAAYAAVGNTSPSASSAATTTTIPANGPATRTSRAAHRPRPMRGAVTAISGNTWTVKAQAGESVTVDITSSTKFGTRAAPSTRSGFAVGDQIIVAGRRTTKTSITATRIVAAGAKRSTAAAASSTD